MTDQIVQGYRPDEYSEKDRVFGSGETPHPIINPSGNWRTIQLTTEFQNRGFETYGCVTFTILNALEKLAKVVFGEDWNKSERFTYIASGTDPANKGNSPRTVTDSVRKQGTINELDLPFDDLIDTLEKFNSPRPLTNFLLEKGKLFVDDYAVSYDYLPQINGQISRETLKEALRRSPVGIAVYAWAEKDGVYVRQGEDVHFTLLENVKDNGELEVFDSYSPAQKTLSKDFPIYVAMRFYIEENLTPQQISIFQKILDFMGRILNLDALLIKKDPVVVPDEHLPPPAPIPPTSNYTNQNAIDYIKTIIADTAIKNGVEASLALAVASCEGGFLNPKIKRINNDKFKSIDRGIFQLNSYWYSNISDADAYDPAKATEWFCKLVKAGRLIDWKYSMKCWGNKIAKSVVLKYIKEEDYNKYA